MRQFVQRKYDQLLRKGGVGGVAIEKKKRIASHKK